MTESIKPRWFRLTPGRLLAVLLAVEVFLWLCERFQWFAFGRHKGYAVLIAVAVVGAALLLMALWFAAALLFRWWFQFSIRSLLWEWNRRCTPMNADWIGTMLCFRIAISPIGVYQRSSAVPVPPGLLAYRPPSLHGFRELL
jgi:hypothetical protein